MDYSVYMSDDGMKKCKLGAYKTHIIKNIEKIGQKKLVVIGGGRRVRNQTVIGRNLSMTEAKTALLPLL